MPLTERVLRMAAHSRSAIVQRTAVESQLGLPLEALDVPSLPRGLDRPPIVVLSDVFDGVGCGVTVDHRQARQRRARAAPPAAARHFDSFGLGALPKF